MRLKSFERVLRLILALFFLLSGILAFVLGNWFTLFVSAISLSLVVFSVKFSDRKGIEFSSLISLVFLFFIFASLFLGEIRFFYQRFWWWDLMLHTVAGFNMGLIGFSLSYYMNRGSKHMELSPYFIALFGFCFAMTLGVFWEFFEFSMDYFFGTSMLKSGLVDTITDLIVTSVGAFVVSTLGFLGLKHYYERAAGFFNNLIFRI